ncbi:MAG: helix-turn-helix transcriptional regulator [Clostridia bacterium]|nr:helix-turn-helix transcriptional regulator [Clostridia bacterium]MEE1025053.1 helix-turn-helix transcriptional regulator [Acutalibacteraceae bacterium]
MENKFAVRMKLIRKEKGWSQKLAAANLGISQALLSHYEKGIRECGLDFIIKASEVYSVSCDYLLGATDNSADTVHSDPDRIDEDLIGSPKLQQSKKDAVASLDILYSIAARLGNPKFHNDFNNIIFNCIYRLMRDVDMSISDKKCSLYTISPSKALLYSEALAKKSEVQLIQAISDMNTDAVIDEKQIRNDYKNTYQSLFSVICSVESQFKR